ncbi:hypothetical protein EVAR_98470_1 [Eumeta japonica]|uniref:Uncharacterized protein n=1 Tax=Eumeta variegata TaxID=151549 RepID=A0A4C1YNF0_EUMVA|nr:hypothetical protein EVAR_98470_1 [Eumeta japonica]
MRVRRVRRLCAKEGRAGADATPAEDEGPGEEIPIHKTMPGLRSISARRLSEFRSSVHENELVARLVKFQSTSSSRTESALTATGLSFSSACTAERHWAGAGGGRGAGGAARALRRAIELKILPESKLKAGRRVKPKIGTVTDTENGAGVEIERVTGIKSRA